MCKPQSGGREKIDPPRGLRPAKGAAKHTHPERNRSSKPTQRPRSSLVLRPPCPCRWHFVPFPPARMPTFPSSSRCRTADASADHPPFFRTPSPTDPPAAMGDEERVLHPKKDIFSTRCLLYPTFGPPRPQDNCVPPSVWLSSSSPAAAWNKSPAAKKSEYISTIPSFLTCSTSFISAVVTTTTADAAAHACVGANAATGGLDLSAARACMPSQTRHQRRIQDAETSDRRALNIDKTSGNYQQQQRPPRSGPARFQKLGILIPLRQQKRKGKGVPTSTRKNSGAGGPIVYTSFVESWLASRT